MADRRSRFRFPQDFAVDLDPVPLLRGPVGALFARPWLDTVSIASIGKFLIPSSRAWAAAELSGVDVERFLIESGLPRPRGAGLALLARALELTERMRRRHAKAEAAWRAGFFPAPDEAPLGSARLKLLQAHRVKTARDWMACRGLFLPFLGKAPPGVRFAIPTPQEMADRFGAAAASPDGLYALPETLPLVEESVGYEAGGRSWSFLRLRHQDGSFGWARVSAPLGAVDPPTVIYLHGLAMEMEMWDSKVGQAEGVLDGHLRVIQLEAPFHSRNRPVGRWGGEDFIATLPAGAIALFRRAFPEIAALSRWARGQGSGPLGLAGVSMGALTAQRAAVEARAWPEDMRPDALFLASTSEDLLEIATEGALGRVFDIKRMAEAAGWNPSLLARWAPFLDPVGAPCMAADHVVLALGAVDDVTPFDGGSKLAKRWGVPAENLFVRPVGHFSAPVSLYRDPAPVERFATVLLG